MASGEYHAFSSRGVHLVYMPESMKFYRLTEEAWAAARQGTLMTDQDSPNEASAAPISSALPDKLPLERLVMIVTTNCNLRCHYCYADGGNYGLTPKNMSVEMAREIVDWALARFSPVGVIQFFGGEPTLNHCVIEAVCEELEQRANREEGAFIPRYGLVTNGIYLPPQLEDIAQRYKINFTYSFDGPAQVHDRYRVRIDGQGSFDLAFANLRKLQQKGLDLGVEMTLTPYAVESGYGVWELAEFSTSELHLPEPHIVPVGTEPNNPIAWDEQSTAKLVASYRLAATRSLQSLAEGHYIGFSLLSGILRALVLRRPRPFICPAGATTLAVDPEGNVYPCFMFAGQPQWLVTNIKDPLDGPGIIRQLESFNYSNRKETHVNCRACWARNLCSGCMGNIQLATGNLNGEWTPMCQIAKALAEEIMIFLTLTREDPVAWKQFVEQYKRLRAFSHDQC